MADRVNDFIIQKLVLGTKRAKPSLDLRAPVSKKMLLQLVMSCKCVAQDSYTHIMFKAMLSLAYHALLRISEMVASADIQQDHRITLRDVTLSKRELVVIFRSYKHSKPGKTFTLAIPKQSQKSVCPVRLMKDYFAERGMVDGPLFVMPGLVAPSPSWFTALLKNTVAAAGLCNYHITSHSFRIGRVCDMAIEGYSSSEIRLAGRWKSDAFRNYIRVSAVRL